MPRDNYGRELAIAAYVDLTLALSMPRLRYTHHYLKPLQSLPPLVPPCKGGKYQVSSCSRQIEQVLPLGKGELEGVCKTCVHTVALGKGELEGV
jgi:hypothetical protein